ncbi:MAG: hypothetical protein AAF196_19775 [Planctomycetota bacterium]
MSDLPKHPSTHRQTDAEQPADENVTEEQGQEPQLDPRQQAMLEQALLQQRQAMGFT